MKNFLGLLGPKCVKNYNLCSVLLSEPTFFSGQDLSEWVFRIRLWFQPLGKNLHKKRLKQDFLRKDIFNDKMHHFST
jgi:hypothetical protein